MTIKFSKETRGFYDSAMHGTNVPDDAVEISTEEFDALFAAQAAGKLIVGDDNGRPIAIDQPAQTAEELAFSVRDGRDTLIAATDWLTQRHRDELDLGRKTTLPPAVYLELLTYRQALRDLPLIDGFPKLDMPPIPAVIAAILEAEQ
ncbi:phage tail assembly chaperone [Pandoraea apista]|uniref:phage tail assembly chaperone n=1 Tax=Pandoraea apista TaxID=93218 RepID=UPI000F674C49|nr:phage tail assembly chaperone [Pandoraea apista]RRW94285.1 phage tail protein [Pandoraea apista]RRX00643.1 phage tail protein [Pandoraea apista]